MPILSSASPLPISRALAESCQQTEPLSEPIGDPSAAQVVRAQLHEYTVTDHDPDVVHPHPAGDPGQDMMPIRQFDIEHRVGASLADHALDLDDFLLGLSRPTGWSSSSGHKCPHLDDAGQNLRTVLGNRHCLLEMRR